ncbi:MULTISPECIES: type IX secretion system plug protein [Aquimarina]|uniref:type IX secretion system plug protein n=2 Tax=Flavobacteriaceae TaxID=49546 RepID=UPI001FB62365|nr:MULTISPECIES: type IX secretion system plug protein domain-containing protein [Aquimarina]
MMSLRFKSSLLLLLLQIVAPYTFFGQSTVNEVNTADHIKTIQLLTGAKFSGVPILKLGDPFRITFDDINGDESDYYYRISHYNFDWTPSSLYKNEYLDGFDEIRIVTYENSFNTLQMYSHYSLSIPNEDTRRLKVSGNYLIEIYDEDDEVVFSRKFIVYEPLTSVKVYTKRSRDLKHIDTKQSVQFEINSPNEILRNPRKTVKTLVMQNNDLKNAITNLVPQFTIANSLVYKYDQESSFWAGNEFLFFDSKDIRASTVSTRSIELKDIYHNYLYSNRVRANRRYTYNPDINGNFVIRNLDAENNNVEADYVWMHFSLECYEPLEGGEIHLYGNFNNYTLDKSTLLQYDKESGGYFNKSIFKQGFYNYKYVLLRPDGTIDPGFISGNFDETENEYTVIPYYRAPGARYDRVIGKGTGNSATITN